MFQVGSLTNAFTWSSSAASSAERRSAGLERRPTFRVRAFGDAFAPRRRSRRPRLAIGKWLAQTYSDRESQAVRRISSSRSRGVSVDFLDTYAANGMTPFSSSGCRASVLKSFVARLSGCVLLKDESGCSTSWNLRFRNRGDSRRSQLNSVNLANPGNLRTPRLANLRFSQKAIDDREVVVWVLFARIVAQPGHRDDLNLGQRALQLFLRLRRDDGASAAQYIDDGRFDLPDESPELGWDEPIPDIRITFPDDPAIGARFRPVVRVGSKDASRPCGDCRP